MAFIVYAMAPSWVQALYNDTWLYKVAFRTYEFQVILLEYLDSDSREKDFIWCLLPWSMISVSTDDLKRNYQTMYWKHEAFG